MDLHAAYQPVTQLSPKQTMKTPVKGVSLVNSESAGLMFGITSAVTRGRSQSVQMKNERNDVERVEEQVCVHSLVCVCVRASHTVHSLSEHCNSRRCLSGMKMSLHYVLSHLFLLWSECWWAAQLLAP